MLKIVTLLTFFTVTPLFAAIHHTIQAEVVPETHQLVVEDQVTFPPNEKLSCESQSYRFKLHANLKPKVVSTTFTTLVFLGDELIDSHHKLTISNYLLVIPCSEKSVTFTYEGEIYHPILPPTNPYARGTSETPGLISSEGVVINSGTYWYPIFDESLVTFTLKVALPPAWELVSQGEELNREWQELNPQTDIYLIAAPFTKYETKTAEGLSLQVYLRTADDLLSSNYLQATADYINQYAKLIGPYPYRKFALVENFWETGFGMPSFTLLGSSIIRLPFIINSSYPHEILHNWWGNSVYVDYQRGNWCEGLTAYLADHLMAEKSGTSENYRRDTLMKFTDFVTAENDFSLEQFKERVDASSEAIGYGKALMFFHMLKEQVGTENFFKALNYFYLTNRFTQVSYREIKAAFETVTPQNLSALFDQWTKRLGAPELKLSDVSLSNTSVTAKITQTQKSEPFSLTLPVVFYFKNSVVKKGYLMEGRSLTINETFDEAPIRLAVDPSFDLFRKVARDEAPAVLTNALGAKTTLFILPANTPEWRNFSDIITRALHSEITVKWDTDEMGNLALYNSIWVLGKNNKKLEEFKQLSKKEAVEIGDETIRFNRIDYPFTNHSSVITLRNKKHENQVWTFVCADPLTAITTLANKLIHYGKYSLLFFENESVVNVGKGVWRVTDSSMSIPLSSVDLTLRQ